MTIAGQTVTVSQGSATINLNGTWLGSSPNQSPGVESTFPISISHPAGSPNFTVSANVSSNGINVVWAGSGTITGTSVRMNILVNTGSGGNTCSGTYDHDLTVNAAGTQMSGNGFGTISCTGLPTTSGGGPVTYVKQ